MLVRTDGGVAVAVSMLSRNRKFKATILPVGPQVGRFRRCHGSHARSSMAKVPTDLLFTLSYYGNK